MNICNPEEREECERCNGMGVITESLNGPSWCPDCDGSGYADGWPEHVKEKAEEFGRKYR